MISTNCVRGELSKGGYFDLAGGSTRLQETLMDGVLQQLFVVAGHRGVSTAASPMVTGRHLEH